MDKELNIITNNKQIEALEALVQSGKTIIKEVLLKAERLSLEGRWRLGDLLASHDALLKSKSQMNYLAEKWGMWVSELYRMRVLRRIYPSIDRLQSAILEIELQGKFPTWAYFRSNVLPQEHHTPEQFGGEENAFSQTLDRIERITHEAAKLTTEVLNKFEGLESQELQSEIEGSLTTVALALDETRQITSRLGSLIKNRPDRSAMHLSAVRKLPCCVCGLAQSQAHHIAVHGLGQKGGDYLTIPLCAFHHQFYTDKGITVWEEKYDDQLDFVIETLSLIYSIPAEAIREVRNYKHKGG